MPIDLTWLDNWTPKKKEEKKGLDLSWLDNWEPKKPEAELRPGMIQPGMREVQVEPDLTMTEKVAEALGDNVLGAAETVMKPVNWLLPKAQAAVGLLDAAVAGSTRAVQNDTWPISLGESIANPITAPLALIPHELAAVEKVLGIGKEESNKAYEQNIEGFRRMWGREPNVLESLSAEPLLGSKWRQTVKPEDQGPFKGVVLPLAGDILSSPSTWLGVGMAKAPAELAKRAASTPGVLAGLGKAAEVPFTSPAVAALFAPDIAKGTIEGVETMANAETPKDFFMGATQTAALGFMGALAARGVAEEATLRNGKLARNLADAAETSRQASIGVQEPLQPTISLKAREAISEETKRLVAASMPENEVQTLAATHMTLADAWEADRQLAPRVAQSVVQGMMVKDPTGAANVLDAITHFTASIHGEDVASRLDSMASRLADRKRLRKLMALQQDGDPLAGRLAAELGDAGALNGRPGTVEDLIEYGAWRRIDESDGKMGVQRALMESTKETLANAGRAIISEMDPKDPNWQSTVRSNVERFNPLDLNSRYVLRHVGDDLASVREAYALSRRIKGGMPEDVQQKWDKISSALAKVYASVDPSRSEADWYRERMTGDGKRNSLRAQAAEADRIFKPFGALLNNDFVDGLRNAYISELVTSDPEAAKYLGEMPLDEVTKRMRELGSGGITSENLDKRLNPLVEKLHAYGATIARTGEVPVVGTAAEKILGSALTGPPIPPGFRKMANEVPMTDVFQGGVPIRAEDIKDVSRLTPKEALARQQARIVSEVPEPSKATLASWNGKVWSSLMRAGNDLNRAIFAPAFKVKRDLFAYGKRIGDFSAFNDFFRTAADIKASNDSLERTIRVATERQDRFNPDGTVVTGYGIRGLWDRLYNTEGMVTPDGMPVAYRDVFNAILYGDHAEHAWDKAVERIGAGDPAIQESAKVIAERLKSREAVKQMSASGEISPNWAPQAEMDAEMFRDFSWRSIVDPLREVGILSAEQEEALRKASTRLVPLPNGQVGPPAQVRTWAPLSYIRKMLEEIDPAAVKEADKAAGGPVINAFDEMDMLPAEIAEIAGKAKKPKKPIFSRDKAINNEKILDPVTALGHRIAMVNAVVARQRAINKLPDLYMRSLLPDGHPLKARGFDLHVAYAGDENKLVNVGGTTVELKANTDMARELKAAGGSNLAVMIEGEKVPFYVDREYAKDLSLLSRNGAAFVSDAVEGVIANFVENKVLPSVRSVAGAVEPLGRLFRMSTTGIPGFAYREALRNPPGASLRSGNVKDVIPFRNLLAGTADIMLARLGLTKRILPEGSALGGNISDASIYDMLKSYGYGQSNIASDTGPRSTQAVMEEMRATMASHLKAQSERGAFDADPKFKDKARAFAYETFNGVASKAHKTIVGVATSGLGDFFKIFSTVGDAPVRADAMVQRARETLASVTREMRDAEAVSNPAYSQFVADGREAEYWLLKNRLPIASVGRESNLDFVNRGAAHATLNALEPFTGVGFIDAESNYWAFRKNPSLYLTKLASLVILPAVWEGVEAANDPADDERSLLGTMAFQKLRVPFSDETFMLPRIQGLPGALSVAVRTMVKDSLRGLAQQDPNAAADVVRKVLGLMAESTPVANWGLSYQDKRSGEADDAGLLPEFRGWKATASIIPFGLDTAFEALTNRNTQFGGKIIPEYDEKVRAELTFKRDFIDFAREMKLSPYQLDYFLSGPTGGSGSFTRGLTRLSPGASNDPAKDKPKRGFLQSIGEGAKNYMWRPQKESIGYRSISVNKLDSIFKRIRTEGEDLSAYRKVGNKTQESKFLAEHPYLRKYANKDAAENSLARRIKKWNDEQKERRDKINKLRNSDKPQDVIDGGVRDIELEMTVAAQQYLDIMRKSYPVLFRDIEEED